MLSNINIKINGLDDKISLEVVSKLREIIKEFNFLDFRRFSNIIITKHFERDIESITTKKQASFKNRYRSNSDTYASVLTLPKYDDFELIMVIKTEFISKLLKDKDNKEYKKAFHIIHHELAHIHDNNKKIDVFKELMKTKSYKGIDSLTYPIAETCWSEYIANFISARSALDTDYPKLMAKNLIEKIKFSKSDIETSLLAYKINRKREDLLQYSILQIESLLKSASYLIGYLNGLNLTLEDLDLEADYEIDVSYFKDIWEVLKDEFATIHQVYPHGFVNLNIYKNLSFYIETFYSQMGIVIDEDKKGKIKIHVM